MIKRKGRPAKSSDAAESSAADAAKVDEIASRQFSTRIRIELLETLKSQVHQGCPMDTAILLAAEACDADQTPHFRVHAADYLSGTNRYGGRTAEDFYRLFSPNVQNGISI